MPNKRRPEGTRAPNGAGTIYFSEADGYWHGRVIVGVKDDGSPDRRHRKAKTEKEVTEKVQKLLASRDNGSVAKPGRVPTVEAWLTHWLENIAKPTVRYKAYQAYRSAVTVHLIPGLGKHRLDRIQPEHFEKLYRKIIESGRKPGTAHQVHRTARTAFGEAYRRGTISRNPVSLAKPPLLEEDEVEPFEVTEIQKLIQVALTRRNGVRFVIALALGLRQGEALGLKWAQLDRENKALRRMVEQLQRRTWEHGCSDPHACGEKHHKRRPCPVPCTRHTRPCPPPCGPNCTEHARCCPQRKNGGLVAAPVKSKAGKRGIALPDAIYTMLLEHERAQQRERDHAGSVWEARGLVFCQPTGRPIDPRRDHEEWESLLTEAGLRDARLHDARHTAATVLALLNVNDRVAMGIMGWSDPSMPKRYQHMTGAVQRGVADRIDAYLWGKAEGTTP